MKQPLRILQLYPRSMNIYGDWGNVLTVVRRAEWHGFEPEIVDYNEGDAFPGDVDIILGGGGQDSGQGAIQDDFLAIGPQLRDLAANGAPMLVVCGLYQMFGHRFITHEGREIRGIGLLDLETRAGPTRLIGNIVSHCDDFGDVIGYENHSGLTYLGPDVAPLARVTKGAGNNGEDGTEGARFENVIGTYLHGPILPKNPQIADFLIQKASERRFGGFEPGTIDDNLVDRARTIAAGRPR